MLTSEISKTIKQLAVIIKKQEDRGDTLIRILMNRDAEAAANAKRYQQSIENNKQDIKQIISESKAFIHKETKEAITLSIKEAIDDLEVRLKKSSLVINEGATNLHRQARTIGLQSKYLHWKSLIAVTAGSLAIIGATTWHTSSQFDAINKAQEDYNNIVLATGVKEKIKYITFKDCDGKLCIKIDAKTQIWGKNKEFAIITPE